MIKQGIIRKYRKFLPPVQDEHIVTLGEGETPLVRANIIEEIVRHLGVDLKIFLKLEGFNPTGSFKDRGLTTAVSQAKAKGIRKVICASTGNTAASAAAYASRAGMECEVYLPKGKVAAGKTAQVQLYGAQLKVVEGSFDDALNQVREIAKNDPTIEIVNSINPYRLPGQKTAAFEICDDLGGAPEYHCIPVGNGGNITAYWMGYVEYYNEGLTNELPKMFGFQAEGAAPIVRNQIVPRPETIATAIRIGNPAHWVNVLKTIAASKGGVHMVSDEEILFAYSLLACKEQVFCEPASAASVAGLLKLVNSAAKTGIELKPGATVVCTLTGHGLKDPDTAAKIFVKKAD